MCINIPSAKLTPILEINPALFYFIFALKYHPLQNVYLSIHDEAYTQEKKKFKYNNRTDKKKR